MKIVIQNDNNGKFSIYFSGAGASGVTLEKALSQLTETILDRNKYYPIQKIEINCAMKGLSGPDNLLCDL